MTINPSSIFSLLIHSNLVTNISVESSRYSNTPDLINPDASCMSLYIKSIQVGNKAINYCEIRGGDAKEMGITEKLFAMQGLAVIWSPCLVPIKAEQCKSVFKHGEMRSRTRKSYTPSWKRHSSNSSKQ